MEASDTSQDLPPVEERTSGDPLPVEHQPIGAEDQHGTVTPRSAPPASSQSGTPLDEDKADEE